MPEVRELEAKLASLRREVAEARRSGFTPLQLRKLQTDCRAIWAEIERHKYDHARELVDTRK
jgi:hypothetical protein